MGSAPLGGRKDAETSCFKCSIKEETRGIVLLPSIYPTPGTNFSTISLEIDLSDFKIRENRFI